MTRRMSTLAPVMGVVAMALALPARAELCGASVPSWAKQGQSVTLSAGNHCTQQGKDSCYWIISPPVSSSYTVTSCSFTLNLGEAGKWGWDLGAWNSLCHQCADSGSINVDPGCLAACTASAPTTAEVGETLAFTATASPSGCTDPISYAWEFGDGEGSSELLPSHAYQGVGRFTWTFSVAAGGVTICTRSGTVTVGCLELGELRLCGDDATDLGGGATRFSGNVRINDVLRFGDDVVFTPDAAAGGAITSGELVSDGDVFVNLRTGRRVVTTGAGLRWDLRGDEGKLHPTSGPDYWALTLQSLELLRGDALTIGEHDVVVESQAWIGIPHVVDLAKLGADLKLVDAGGLQLMGVQLLIGQMTPSVKFLDLGGTYDDEKDSLELTAEISVPFSDYLAGESLVSFAGAFRVDPCGLNALATTIGGWGFPNVPLNPNPPVWLLLQDFSLELDHICDEKGFVILIGGNGGLCLGAAPLPDSGGCAGIPPEFFAIQNMMVGYQHPYRALLRAGTPTVLGYPLASASAVLNMGDPPRGIHLWGEANIAGVLQGRADLGLLFSRVRLYGSLAGTLEIPNFSCGLTNPLCKLVKLKLKRRFGELPRRVGPVVAELYGAYELDPRRLEGSGRVRYFDSTGEEWSSSFDLTASLDFSVDNYFYRAFSGGTSSPSARAAAAAVERTLVLSAPERGVVLGGVGTAGPPALYLRTPSGATVTPDGVSSFPGIEHTSDSAENSAAFFIAEAAAGTWTIGWDGVSGGSVTLAAGTRLPPPELAFTSVAQQGTQLDISVAVTPASAGTRASLFYSSPTADGLLEAIAEDLDAASGAVSATWDLAAVPPGTYLLVARADDGANLPVEVTYAQPVTVTTTGLEPPTSLTGQRTGATVRLDWTPSPSPAVIGYTVIYGDAPELGALPLVASTTQKRVATVTDLDPTREYRFAVVGYDAQGHSTPASNSWATGGAAPPQVTALESGRAIGDGVQEGAFRQFFIRVPAGSTGLTVRTSGATGNVDLYLRYGASPTVSTHDYASRTASGAESVTVTPASAPTPLAVGDWFVGVRGVQSASFTVTATIVAVSPCSLWCDAAAPASVAVGAEVTLTASPSVTGCGGQPTYDWDFGDGSPHSSEASPQHEWAADGVYTWLATVTADGQACVSSGEITVGNLVQCVVSCEATGPGAGSAGEALAFTATATASNCSAAVAHDWDFGDGSPHATTTAATHAFAAPGTYAWTFTAAADGQVCSRSGSVTVTAPPQSFRAVVPSAAHSPGAQGTQWRTDVAAVNRSASPAFVTLAYYPESGATASHDLTLAAGATAEWRDILVSSLGIAAASSSKGTLHVLSSTPLVVTSRTYNQTATGTFGQYYPALAVTDALSASQTGVIAQIKKNDAFRTNLGVVNLGDAACTVAIQLLDASGAATGTLKRLTVDPGRWKQQDDIFKSANAGTHQVAYATVRVETPGGLAWAYASVVDNATGDPTTIPVIVAPQLPVAAPAPAAPRPAPVAARLTLPRGVRRAAPPAARAAAAVTTLFADSFEGAFPGAAWQLFYEGSTTWGRSTQRAAAGAASVWCAGGGESPAAPGGDYPNDMASWMVYGPFSLADADAARATFSYWMKTEQEWGTDPVWGDPFYWMLSTDGEHFSGYRNSGDSEGWRSATLDFSTIDDLEALGQDQVWLAFVFESDVGIRYEGIYVDDLRIEATTGSAQCVVSCEATGPGAGSAGEALAFTATATASNCSAAVAHDWDFGDGSPHATTTAATHAFAAPGTYAWTFTAAADGQVCSRSGSVTVTAPPQSFRAVVPSAAHSPGAQGTQWRTDVAAVNRSASPAFVTLAYYPESGATASHDLTLAAGATAEWRDILVSSLGIAAASSSKGTLHVLSSTPLVVTSRTYNQTATGTFGQYYPALAVTDALSASQTGVIAQIKKNDAFRTNLGVVNLGDAACTVAIQLLDASGAATGTLKRLTVDPGRWKQQDDIFKSANAGTHQVAYATVRVETPGGLAWAYASVVDNATGDPTTIPVIVQP